AAVWPAAGRAPNQVTATRRMRRFMTASGALGRSISRLRNYLPTTLVRAEPIRATKRLARYRSGKSGPAMCVRDLRAMCGAGHTESLMSIEVLKSGAPGGIRTKVCHAILRHCGLKLSGCQDDMTSKELQGVPMRPPQIARRQDQGHSDAERSDHFPERLI